LYRLNTVTIRVPPLRDRREDIPVLATYFLGRYAARYRKPITNFDPAAMQVLLDYPWPGNVRELDHTVERAVLMGQGTSVVASDLGLELRATDATVHGALTLDQLEERAIRTALTRSSGDVSKAAEALGLSRGALYRRMEKYQISG
jgi:DNA-binding NtrC family response regulator